MTWSSGNNATRQLSVSPVRAGEPVPTMSGHATAAGRNSAADPGENVISARIIMGTGGGTSYPMVNEEISVESVKGNGFEGTHLHRALLRANTKGTWGILPSHRQIPPHFFTFV